MDSVDLKNTLCQSSGLVKYNISGLRKNLQIVGTLYQGLDIRVKVENRKDMAVSEVIQVYCKVLDSKLSPPNGSLRGFRRVEFQGAGEKEVTIHIDPPAFMVVNEDGELVKDGNKVQVSVGFGQPDARTKELTGKECRSFVVEW